MSDYDFRPGGSLKLKSGVFDGGVTKKCVVCFAAKLCLWFTAVLLIRKKRTSVKAKDKGFKTSEDPNLAEDIMVPISEVDSLPQHDGDRGFSMDPAPSSSASSSKKTDAERRFEEIQRKRVRTCYQRHVASADRLSPRVLAIRYVCDSPAGETRL